MQSRNALITVNYESYTIIIHNDHCGLAPPFSDSDSSSWTAHSDTVNISFASKKLSSLVVMTIHLSVVSVALNILVTDADTKSVSEA